MAKKVVPVKKERFGFWHQTVLAAVVASLLLVVANTAIWANRSIFDNDTFTKTAVTSITSDSSRQALADEIVARALQDRPVIQRVAGPTATKLVSGLLASDQATNLLTKAVGRLQIYLTSKEHKTVTLDLSGVKNVLQTLLSVADKAGVNANTDAASTQLGNVPDQLVLIDGSTIPTFYSYGVALLWIAPICVLLALGLLAMPYIRRKNQYTKISLIQGAIVVVFGCFALLLGPLLRPPVLANVVSPNMRIVVGNLYNSFISIFNGQTMVLIVLAAILMVAPTAVDKGLQFYRQRTAKKK